MKLFPAIDLYDKKAVRLFKGNYDEMTVYSDDPVSVAEDFVKKGAECAHLVDLQGARDGDTPNYHIVKEIASKTDLFTEIGGGIRNLATIEKYLDAGVDRVILGTGATDEAFLKEAVSSFKDRIAAGIDIKDGYVAVKGWTESTDIDAFDFFQRMEDAGIKTVICTDISRDGAMKGTNRELYRELSKKFKMDITASGGVSTLDDIKALKDLGIYAAIIGKAYYTGDIDLAEALEIAG